MTASDWDRTDDWSALLSAAGPIDRSRRLRLWCAACARAVLAVAPGHGPFDELRESAWFTPAALDGYARACAAAEEFADGRLTRRQLTAARPPTGGPWNLFMLPVRVSWVTTAEAQRLFAQFSAEFAVPPAATLAALARDIFGNPFRPVAFAPEWRTDTTVAIAQQMYESRDFSAMPILADALQDAGCDSDDILNHCREPGEHVRGCWVTDLVLGRA